MSLDHCYSLSAPKRPCDDTVSNNTERKRCMNNSPVSTSTDDECSVRRVSSPRLLFHPEDKSQAISPLAMLFPDCILCVWSANVYSHAVVADLHTRAVEYAGDERPHIAVYSACVDDWYECHKVAELAPTLTKGECVAHFTSNILCRFNLQRSQPASLYHRKTVSRLVDTFPYRDTAVFVNNQRECSKDKSTVFWCHNAFFCFLTVQIAKLFNLTLPPKKRRHLYAVLQRHTDIFISQWHTGFDT
jgi:hypothetical protein